MFLFRYYRPMHIYAAHIINLCKHFLGLCDFSSFFVLFLVRYLTIYHSNILESFEEQSCMVVSRWTVFVISTVLFLFNYHFSITDDQLFKLMAGLDHDR